jgi:hypothetical protein
MSPAPSRRTFLAQTAAVAATALSASPLRALKATTEPGSPRAPYPVFPDASSKWRRTWDAALDLLAKNVRVVPRYDHPVLLEGAVYPGV